jgi:hypothetical protein
MTIKKTSFHCYSFKKLCTYGRLAGDQTLKHLRVGRIQKEGSIVFDVQTKLELHDDASSSLE